MSEENKEIKVLLLEDEEALAKLYIKKLEEAGYQTMLCKDTQCLIDCMESFRPNIAFLDHSIQGDDKSGMDVIPVLKEKNPGMKVVMLSNFSEFQIEKAAKEAGADEYLLKINTPPNVLIKVTKRLTS